ncbi:MAG: prepilin-type N-terminal cleavage/methylation domain-containing protein [Oscillospiraceae bacterium]|nr:prepilin-type N-terminal cleavage/methylation domain-containing protein [Oscillospiraceae bacterium]
MLKRFFSNRSGFTLVEIIIAMVIFAFMSTMIAEILQLSLKTRKDINDYGKELAVQEQQLAKVSKDASDFQNKTADYSMKFNSTDGSNQYDVSLAYQIKDSVGGNTAVGINYFVSPVNYDGTFGDVGSGSGNIGGGGGSQSGGEMALAESRNAGIANIRISGSKGLEYVQVRSVQQVYPIGLTGTQTRYVFTCSASSATMAAVDKPYSEYVLYFYMDGQIDPVKSAIVNVGVDPNTGAEYQYTNNVPLAAKVIRVGYCDASGNEISRSNGTHNYTVRGGGSNSVRVGVPFRKEGGIMTNYVSDGFNSSSTITFFVDFEEDPGNLTTDSFGTNGGAGAGGGTRYSLYNFTNITYDNLYIYGAYPYQMNVLSNNSSSGNNG